MATSFDLDRALDRAHAEPGSRRASLLRAAERLFAKHGFAGVRVRDVADAAGVNIATLHLHWKSKTLLYEAVCRLHARELLAFADRARREVDEEDLPLRERIERWVEEAIGFLATHPAIAPIALQSVADQTPPEIPSLFFHDVNLFRSIECKVGAAMTAREREVEPIFAVLSVFYFIIVAFEDSPLQQALLGGSVYDDAKVRERLAGFVKLLVTQLTEQRA